MHKLYLLLGWRDEGEPVIGWEIAPMGLERAAAEPVEANVRLEWPILPPGRRDGARLGPICSCLNREKAIL